MCLSVLRRRTSLSRCSPSLRNLRLLHPVAVSSRTPANSRAIHTRLAADSIGSKARRTGWGTDVDFKGGARSVWRGF